MLITHRDVRLRRANNVGVDLFQHLTIALFDSRKLSLEAIVFYVVFEDVARLVEDFSERINQKADELPAKLIEFAD